MAANHSPTVLVASRNERWRASCLRRLVSTGCDIHTASDGFRAIDNLRKHRYEMVVFDDSLQDVSAIELHLTVEDITHNEPAELIGLADQNAEKIRKRLKGDRTNALIGTPDEVLERIVPVLERTLTENGAHHSSRHQV
jgi:CheY-like chemotaxis protein